jgi:hypothetical protein
MLTQLAITAAKPRAKPYRLGDGGGLRELNDAFRTNFACGTVLLSASVDALPDMMKANALVEVAQFTAFDADNDPHGEHDFGSFTLCGRQFFWKIDY